MDWVGYREILRDAVDYLPICSSLYIVSRTRCVFKLVLQLFEL